MQRPKVGRFSFQDIPVIAYTINTSETGPDALVNLRNQVETKLSPELKAVPGVNSVVVAGGGNKQVLLTFDAQKLQKYGLQESGVTGVLQANSISFPTGQIVNQGQSIPVRVENQFNTLDDLRNLVVRPEIPAGAAGGAAGAGSAQGASGQGAQGASGGASSSGNSQAGTSGAAGGASGTGAGAQSGAARTPSAAATPIPAVKLSDVATVALANAGGETISRSNGKPNLSIIVYKTQNTNTVQVSDSVNAKVNGVKQTIPGTQTEVLFDQATYITDSSTA